MSDTALCCHCRNAPKDECPAGVLGETSNSASSTLDISGRPMQASIASVGFQHHRETGADPQEPHRALRQKAQPQAHPPHGAMEQLNRGTRGKHGEQRQAQPTCQPHALLTHQRHLHGSRRGPRVAEQGVAKGYDSRSHDLRGKESRSKDSRLSSAFSRHRRRRLSSPIHKPPTAEPPATKASVKAAPCLTVQRSIAKTLDRCRSEGQSPRFNRQP